MSNRTTTQMQNAPLGAFYVWHNGELDHPRNLAVTLQRGDLRVVSPAWVRPENLCGHWSPVVVDPATDLSTDQRDELSCHAARLSRR